MSTLPSKNIDEIKFAHELEPLLATEIYVEGSTDKELIDSFLKFHGINDIFIFNIDTVNIPDDIFTKHNSIKSNNKRNHIVVLCHELNEYVFGIIDSDFDYIQSRKYPPSIIKTDHSAMEMYLFNEKTMEKLFRGYSSIRPDNLNHFLNEMGKILHEVFLIRYTKEHLEKSISHRKLESELSIKKKIIKFDRNTYLKHYLASNTEKVKRFNTFIDDTRKKITVDDFRNYVHGHDFIDFLQAYLDIKHKETREHFPKLLYALLDFDDFNTYSLFVNIKNLSNKE